ncbi:MAG: ribosome recycling factor [Candidatus Kapabacteria bacterium]|nr:ribosome recycling factor [Candidatus Kapabacteria bacterium]
MSVQVVLDSTKTSMTKAVEFCKQQIAKVRTGRASASLVDNVKADYYGSPTPLAQMASVSVPDARSIIIQPYDRSTLQTIEKAIQMADLGFNPQNDGNIIRINVPPLTEERRKEFVKLCKKYAEEGRVSIRNVRRDEIEVLRKGEKDKEFTEDERKSGEEKIQKITDDYIKEIDVIINKKEKELLDN